MAKIILVFGLPSSGKSALCNYVLKEESFKDTEYIKDDEIRRKYNDGDYSVKGQIRQAEIIYKIAYESQKEYALCDFVCPIASVRNLFKDSYKIYMNTIKSCRFEGANKMFQPPKEGEYNLEIRSLDNMKQQAHIISAMAKCQLFSFAQQSFS